MSVDHIVSEIYNRIWKVVLIGVSTTLLDYDDTYAFLIFLNETLKKRKCLCRMVNIFWFYIVNPSIDNWSSFLMNKKILFTSLIFY